MKENMNNTESTPNSAQHNARCSVQSNAQRGASFPHGFLLLNFKKILLAFCLSFLTLAGLPVQAAELSINDGVVVKLGTTAQFVVRDKLSTGKSVVFTSDKDDALLGALSNNAQSPASGDWRGMQVENSATLIADTMSIRYAGAEGSAALQLRGTAPSSLNKLQISDSVIGLRLLKGASPSIEGGSFMRNGIALEAAGNAAPVLSQSQFAHNTSAAIVNHTPETLIEALGNWWGHASGPQDPVANPQGQGDSVSTGVNYASWLTASQLLNPYIRLASASNQVHNPVVTVLLGCVNATEYRIAESNSFSGIDFKPLTSQASPVNVTLSAGDGPKQLYVQYRDAAGKQVSTSLAGGIYLNAQGPIITLTNPMPDSVLSQPITIEATVTSSVAIVDVAFYVDDQLLGQKTSAPYHVAWDPTQASEGAHTIKLVAKDAMGLVSEKTYSVTVTRSPDTPRIVSRNLPVENYKASSVYTSSQSAYAGFNGGSWLSSSHSGWVEVDLGATYTISQVAYVYNVQTSSGNRFETRVDKILVATTRDDYAEIYSESVFAQHGEEANIALSPVVARYVRIYVPNSASWVGALNIRVFGVPYPLTSEPDTNGPLLSNIRWEGQALANGNVLSGDGLVTMTASDRSGVARIDVLLDDQPLGEATQQASSYNSYSALLNLAAVTDGAHTLSLRAVDTLNNVSQQYINIMVAHAAPAAPVITQPSASTTTRETSLTVAGTAPANTQVQLSIDDVATGAPIATGSDKRFLALITLKPGANVITAKSSNAWGTSLPSNAVTITVDSAVPQPPLNLTATMQASGKIKLSWTKSSDPSVTHTVIYRSMSSFVTAGEASQLAKLAPTVNNYDDLPLEDGSYYYRLASLNAQGTLSALSNEARATSDNTPPSAQIVYSPAGKTDPETGRIGQGRVDLTLTVSEALASPPYLAIIPPNGLPLVVELTQTDATHYQGSFIIGPDTPSGTAIANFSARDLLGNRGTEVKTGLSLKIDTEGPAITGIATSPVSPIAADTHPEVTATFTFSKALKHASTPSLSYRLSGPLRVETPLTQLTQLNPLTWQAQLTLPSDAGLSQAETLSFNYRGQDELDNVSTKISAPNRIQVYQKDLPPLDIPLGLKAQALPGGKVKLSWQAVDGATAYQIYRQAPNDSALTAYQRTSGTDYLDSVPQDGTYLYAIASIRQSNDQESLSNMSAQVSVNASATAPGAPQNLSLELTGLGIQATWQAPLGNAPASYTLYRSPAAAINSTDGLTPIKTAIKTPYSVDSSPSPTEHAYAVTALDAAGNESALSNTAYLNFDLLPVNTLHVDQIGSEQPVIRWTSVAGAGVAGYNVYVGTSTNSTPAIKLNSSLLTDTQLTDTGYTSGERHYTVSAADSHGTEIARSILLPNIATQVISGLPLKRGLMNKLQVQVTNLSAAPLINARTVLSVGNQEHRSEAYTLEANETRMIPVIVGGYATLSNPSALTAGIELTPNEGERVRINRTDNVAVADGRLVMSLAPESFIRGGTGKVRLVIENTSDVEVELLTATNNGRDASPELTFTLLDRDRNTIASQAYQQVLGANVITLASGQTVARLPAGASYTSDVFELNVPAAAPQQLIVRLEVAKLHYHLGQEDHVAITGLGTEKSISLADTDYTGEITDIAPVTSFGDRHIQIQGRSLARDSQAAQASVPLKLILNQQGFERRIDLVTDSAGQFTHTFIPTATDAGLYQVAALHPALTDRPVQGQFVINRVLVGPTPYQLKLARNYPFTIDFRATAGAGTRASGLTLVYAAEDQPTQSLPEGISVELPAPTSIDAQQNRTLPVTISANNNAQASGILILKLLSAESGANPIGTLRIDYTVSEAKPLLRITPSYLETGLAQGSSILETLTLENQGLSAMQEVSLSLTDKTGASEPNSVPTWVALATPPQLGTLAIGDKKSVEFNINPPSSLAEGIYEYQLNIKGNNIPDAFAKLFISVTQSGIGSTLFKLSDMYTATLNKQGQRIEGLAGAKIILQNEAVASQRYEGVSDALGEAFFESLPAGRYTYRASAANHQESGGRLQIKPGITTNQPVFLDYNLINVDWSVSEVTIDDTYDIILNATFETDVPAAVVVLEPPSINLPKMVPGEVYYGQLTLTNYGLVRAENVKQTLPPSDAFFKIEFLTPPPSALDAKQRVSLPYRVTALQSLDQPTGRASGAGCYSYSNATQVSCSYVCANGQWTTVCGSQAHWYANSNSSCPAGGGGGGGGGGGNGGGGGGGGGGSSGPSYTDLPGMPPCVTCACPTGSCGAK